MKTESVRVQREMGSEKTRRKRYAELIIGKKDLWSMVKYELIVMLCAGMPGALGLLLRSRLYPHLLKKCGHNVMFGTNVVMRHPNKIEIEDDVIIDDNCLLDAKGRDNSGIKIGKSVFIGRNSIMSCKNGDIQLGENVNIGFNVEIFSGSSVVVGKDTHIAAYSYLIGGDHIIDDVNSSITEQGSISHGIVIGNNCWLGAAVKVLDNISVGDNVIIGAGAVVIKNIAENIVAAGVPAKIIKTRLL